MTVYTTTQTYDQAKTSVEVYSLTVKDNGGSVDVQRAFDGGWITVQSITEDSVTLIETGKFGAAWRVVPTSGAAFEPISLQDL